MSKRTIYIVVAVAVAAVVLGGVLIAMPKKTVAPSGVNVGAGASTAASASTGASGTTAPSDTSASSSTSQASNTTGDTGSGSGLKGSTSSKSTTSTIKPIEDSSDIVYSNTRQFKPFTLPNANTTSKAPAANGQALAKLAYEIKESDNVIAGLQLGKLPRNSQYAVTVRPIGWGAELKIPNTSAVFADRLMVQVDSATPRGSVPADTYLKGNKVLAIYDTPNIGKGITKGGTYKAIIAWESDGTHLYPVLRNVQ